MKTSIEVAMRQLMSSERSKNTRKWPEGDVRRTITVSLWELKTHRDVAYEEKCTKEDTSNGR
jgi:hypothetical protein